MRKSAYIIPAAFASILLCPSVLTHAETNAPNAVSSSAVATSSQEANASSSDASMMVATDGSVEQSQLNMAASQQEATASKHTAAKTSLDLVKVSADSVGSTTKMSVPAETTSPEANNSSTAPASNGDEKANVMTDTDQTLHVEAASFSKSTGDIYVRHSGEAQPIATKDKSGTTDFSIQTEDGSDYVDFSDPVLDTSTYQNTIPEGQDTVTWTISVPKSGVYEFAFKYNNPGSEIDGNRNARDERNCRIMINNADDFLSDQGWAGWMIFNMSGYNSATATQDTPQTLDTIYGNKAWNNNYMNIYLDAGVNTVTLGIQAPPGQAVFDGPNLDYFDVSYIGDQFAKTSDIPYVSDDFQFTHPGVYFKQADLDRMKALHNDLSTVEGKGYQELVNSPLSKSDYVPKPVETIDVGPYNNPNHGGTEFTKDAVAAEYNMLRWYMDGDVAHAQAAIRILNAWSTQLKTVADGNDLKLRFSLMGPYFVNAAEMLKYIYNNDPDVAEADKWQPDDIANFDAFLKDKLVAKTSSYYPQANGAWDTTIGAFNMAAAVYLNDTQLFNTALTNLYLGDIGYGGNVSSMGALPNYIYPTGESQETDRDQGHSRIGITGLALQAETAWNQGVDIYSAYNSRILAGVKYNAQYTIGESVPSETFASALTRGTPSIYSTAFEILGNHYTNEADTDTDISAITAARDLTMRNDGVKDEAGSVAGYIQAMIFDGTKQKQISIHYQDIAGNELHQPTNITGITGQSYDVSTNDDVQATLHGLSESHYTLKQVSGPVSGTVADSNLTIIYQFVAAPGHEAGDHQATNKGNSTSQKSDTTHTGTSLQTRAATKQLNNPAQASSTVKHSAAGQKAASLPATGDHTSLIGVMGGLLVVLGSALGLIHKRKDA